MHKLLVIILLAFVATNANVGHNHPQYFGYPVNTYGGATHSINGGMVPTHAHGLYGLGQFRLTPAELRIVDEICVSFCNTFVAPLAFVCIPLCESMPDLIYSIGKGNPAGIKNAICNQVPWTNPLYPFCHL